METTTRRLHLSTIRVIGDFFPPGHPDHIEPISEGDVCEILVHLQYGFATQLPLAEDGFRYMSLSSVRQFESGVPTVYIRYRTRHIYASRTAEQATPQDEMSGCLFIVPPCDTQQQAALLYSWTIQNISKGLSSAVNFPAPHAWMILHHQDPILQASASVFSMHIMQAQRADGVLMCDANDPQRDQKLYEFMTAFWENCVPTRLPRPTHPDYPKSIQGIREWWAWRSFADELYRQYLVEMSNPTLPTLNFIAATRPANPQPDPYRAIDHETGTADATIYSAPNTDRGHQSDAKATREQGVSRPTAGGDHIPVLAHQNGQPIIERHAPVPVVPVNLVANSQARVGYDNRRPGIPHPVQATDAMATMIPHNVGAHTWQPVAVPNDPFPTFLRPRIGAHIPSNAIQVGSDLTQAPSLLPPGTQWRGVPVPIATHIMPSKVYTPDRSTNGKSIGDAAKAMYREDPTPEFTFPPSNVVYPPTRSKMSPPPTQPSSSVQTPQAANARASANKTGRPAESPNKSSDQAVTAAAIASTNPSSDDSKFKAHPAGRWYASYGREPSPPPPGATGVTVGAGGTIPNRAGTMRGRPLQMAGMGIASAIWDQDESERRRREEEEAAKAAKCSCVVM